MSRIATSFAQRSTAMSGFDRFTARLRVVGMMEERGLIEKVEDYLHTVPHGDRGGVPIEPLLTDQWYVDAKTLAQPAIEAVRAGRTVFVPKNWEKTYFEWMDNIQPWCVSRQLWWGHRIPAWYAPDGKVFVAYSEAEAQKAADGELWRICRLSSATRTSSTRGFLRHSGRSRRLAGPRRRPSSSAITRHRR